ncbi:MAG: HD domain-containing protein [Thermoanaerobaculia bacterium]|nr:HD domain-containing protein [Thermoanaerobaculia bacterium]
MTEKTVSLEELADTGHSIEDRFGRRVQINLPPRHGKKLPILIEAVNGDDDLYGLWLAANANAMERLGMTDHGPVHVKIVMNIALKILRLITDGGVQPAIVRNYGMENEDAEVVVALAALFHDLGMSIHRVDHEAYSLFIAESKLKELLPLLYERGHAAIVRSETLHAIISHRSGGKPLTLEAGIVRIADALDMAQGRSRIPFERGSHSIHSISAAAIEGVTIETGDTRPVRVRVEMNNSAGVFQLDRLFREKLSGSGLEDYVELEAQIPGEEKHLVSTFRV